MKQIVEITPIQIETLAKRHNEPDWFIQKRQAALKLINDLPLPVFEKINYKNWPLLKATDPNIEPPKFQTLEAPLFQLDEKQIFFYQKGQNKPQINLPESLQEKGVILTDIFTAMTEYPELIKAYFMQVTVKPQEDKMTAFHTALMNSGLFLYIPENVVIKEPIMSYVVQDGSYQNDFIHHVLIVAEKNSEISYIENFRSKGTTPNLANIIVEVIAKENSRIRFAAVDALGESVTTYLNRRAHLMADAKIDWAIGCMNDGNIVSDFDSDLVGTGSHAETKVVALATGKQMQGIDTRVTNIGQRSIGHILQHGVILQKGALVFNGIGLIKKGAKGADAQQENRVLMLSDQARGDANPLLLINENDVKAGHAASVGRVDEQQMYYLMSRGLTKELAQRLVIRGFLGTVLAGIPDKTSRQQLTEMIERKLINA